MVTDPRRNCHWRSMEGCDRELLVAKHKKFLRACLGILPEYYCSLDTSRVTLLFFTLSGLDVLNAIEEIDAGVRERAINWIYSLQLTGKHACSWRQCGFRGSKANSGIPNDRCHQYDSGHLAMTYSALACLLILGDDLSRVDRLSVLAGVKACQLADGSFFCTPDGSENDMRFVYCATAICSMLQDWRAINVSATLDYIRQSLAFDGGFGQGPTLESHGGSTFCALAALDFLGKLTDNSTLPSQVIERLKRWCVWKQNEGFHGRADKQDDSCYTFWLGASLHLLNAQHMIDREKLIEFTLSTQDDAVGGFGKYDDSSPDALHTYFSLAGLSLLKFPGLQPVHPSLNITLRAVEHLNSLKANWSPIVAPVVSCCTSS